jgi:pimeloyl-ACP methyl ester carboxylesterase
MKHSLICIGSAAILAACAVGSPPEKSLPRLSGATGAPLATTCEALANFKHPSTSIQASITVAAGQLSNAGTPVPEHCVVTGRMNERVSPVDGQRYAIGFQMRLPKDWNGRFFHQANGGIDGVVAPAFGGLGGGPLQNALQLGFAVISSDAGHSAEQNPLFGLDPQARADYGYQAVGALTPMAKGLIKVAYGKGPDRSYFGGGSNGGRHTMVAAARHPDEYDGYFAIAPGFNLPKAAIAQLWGAQQWAKVATDVNNLETALTSSERNAVARSILGRCDALDGLADGMVHDVERCRAAFDVMRDVPACAGARDGTCLSQEQKSVLATIYRGPFNKAGKAQYARWPFDPGLASPNWANWKFRNSVGSNRDPVASVIFAVPPEPARLANTLGYALGFSLDVDAPKFYATNETFKESSIQVMTPPNPTNLDRLRHRGAKMIVVHGLSDGVFSPDDTAAWYDALNARYAGRAADAVRFFTVPGMAHVVGGPSTDQYDALKTLVDWVEKGVAPDRIIATARGAGNPGGVNAELPANWAPHRTRPLCPYPLVARYKAGDPDAAASFACER